MVPFRFNPNQAKFYAKVRKQYGETGRIRAIALKARRVGISSAIDGLAWAYCQAHSNRNAKIVAHQATSSKALFRVPTDLANAYPYTKSDNVQERRIIFPHPGGKSLLEIATAGTPSAGRGETLAYLHLCLRGDSLVFTPDGNMVRIDSLREGDWIRTHTGCLAKVRTISFRSDDRKIVRIRTWMNFDTISLTHDHKVFTNHGWVEAGKLSSEHYIGTAIRKFSQKITRADWPKYRDVRGRLKAGSRRDHSIELDREFGFLCGYYLAEGSIKWSHGMASAIDLAHHKNEASYAQRAFTAVKKCVSSSSTINLDGNRARTVIYGSALSRWIQMEFGDKDSKRIPEWIFDTRSDFAEGIVLGYIAGDGSKKVSRKGGYFCPSIYVTSVRPRLIYQLRHLLAALDIGWAGTGYQEGFVDSRGWNNRSSWTLCINGNSAIILRRKLGLENVENSERRKRGMRYFVDGGYVWCRVKSVSPDTADCVWDIEVDHVDHSFETVIGCVANSECAMYESGDSFVSMLSAVSKGPDTMIFLESTANGREGPGEDFADYWDGAVRGDNDFVPIFLSWLDDPACVADPEEAEDAPADDLEKELMEHFGASLAQIAWMRRTKSTECRNLEQLFLQEYPHTPDVAFQVSGDPAFPRDELAYAESTVKDAVATGTLYRAGLRWEFKSDARGHLALWEYPNPRHKYYIGADAALGGEEGDFAAYCIYNGTTGNVAARFAERIHPEQLADQLDMAGRWYHNAMVNIELTGNLGRWAQKLLRDSYMYPNVYRWKGKDDRMRGHHKSIALGFETTQATRRLLFDSFRYALRLGLNGEPGGLSINDRVLMSQMSSATIKDWSWDVRHGHDDVLMASMIAVLTCSQYPPPRFERGNKKPEEDRRQSLGTLSPRVLAVAELNEPMQLRNELKRYWDGVRKRPAKNRLAGV